MTILPKRLTPLEQGSLTQAAALSALSAAARAATDALPAALLKCGEDRTVMRRLVEDRDVCQLAYANALARSLKHTGQLFEQAASELEETTERIAQDVKKIETAAEAIGLFADLVRLSSKLALAFA